MRSIYIVAEYRKQTGWASAFCATGLVQRSHAIHIGRRAPYIADIPTEIVHLFYLFNLIHYRVFAAALNETTLLHRNGAKTATAEASAVNGHAVSDHFVSRNGWFFIVARVGKTGVRERIDPVQFFGR
ncbi:hypothetical protein SDC9_53431 [bioreactor metagenome]|uniref:Uncharacterized protein n=1 Tax=bioreactor metagenome TaxID=1076179 RepID=A0A644WT74_9ZZZZ